jgi:hypothetical protein
MAYNPSVFHRELKNIYGIVSQSLMGTPTDYNPSVFHREFKQIYGIVPQSPTESLMELPNYITDGLTDGLRTSQSIACQTSVCRHKYQWIFRQIEKSGGIFELFWCAYQLISDDITDEI